MSTIRERCEETKRSTLKKTDLDKLKEWLTSKDIPYRGGKGDTQVIQIKHPKYGWQVVYHNKSLEDHYSVNRNLVLLVNAFNKEML